jgi:CheY-like chemotaxis protein
MKILWFDDETDATFLCNAALSQKGHVIVASENCEEMFPLIKREHPDVIIMDNHMPGTSGIQAVKKIKQSSFASIPVIYCSADTATHPEAKIAGAAQCLAKPFTITQIEECLEQCNTNS